MSIERKVKKIVANLSDNQLFKTNPSIIPNDCVVSVDFSIDSLSFIELITELEEEFDIEIDEEEIEINIEVGKLIEMVKNKIFEGEKHELRNF